MHEYKLIVNYVGVWDWNKKKDLTLLLKNNKIFNQNSKKRKI